MTQSLQTGSSHCCRPLRTELRQTAQTTHRRDCAGPRGATPDLSSNSSTTSTTAATDSSSDCRHSCNPPRQRRRRQALRGGQQVARTSSSYPPIRPTPGSAHPVTSDADILLPLATVVNFARQAGQRSIPGRSHRQAPSFCRYACGQTSGSPLNRGVAVAEGESHDPAHLQARTTLEPPTARQARTSHCHLAISAAVRQVLESHIAGRGTLRSLT